MVPGHLPGFELKCVPVNWIDLRSCHHFTDKDGFAIQRYAQSSHLNTVYKCRPRETRDWIPTAMYEETSFPYSDETSKKALSNLEDHFSSTSQVSTVLDMLREIYSDMGDRESDNCDQRLQTRVTLTSVWLINTCEKAIDLYDEREQGWPRSAMSVWEAFKTSNERL